MLITLRKGFTLIELLIVVAIIGILASVILVGLGPSQRAGRDARRIADLRQVQTGLQLYYQKNSKYPDSVSGTTNWTDLQTKLQTVGIPNLPKDPAATNSYQYLQGGSGNTYVLSATLEDANNNKGGLTSNINFGGSVDQSGNVSGGTTVTCGGTAYCLTF
ncbi:MAG: type II secretion system protein [Candidatus Liptonbacteria bacterium]|nr:type II secretion system protein [Candidatus Liptonbacteria bacterium]